MTTVPTITPGVVAATASAPQRVGLTVAAASADTVTVTRVQAAGRFPVLGLQQRALSGSTYVEDFTAPFGENVQYVGTATQAGVDSAESSPTTAIQITTLSLWIGDPEIPGSDVVAFPLDDGWKVRTLADTSSYIQPIGGDSLVVLSGQRLRRAFHFTTYVTGQAARLAMETVLNSAQPMLFRPPPAYSESRCSGYYGVKDIIETAGTDYLYYQFDFDLVPSYGPLTIPGYGLPGQTWADVPGYWSTWNTLVANKPTWIDVLKKAGP